MKLFYGVPTLHSFASQEGKCPEIEGVAESGGTVFCGFILGCLVLVADTETFWLSIRLSPIT